MSDTLLKVRDLKIGATIYPPGERPRDIEIVHGVSFDLAPGKVLGLIGESGAGKSTIGLASMTWRQFPSLCSFQNEKHPGTGPGCCVSGWIWRLLRRQPFGELQLGQTRVQSALRHQFIMKLREQVGLNIRNLRNSKGMSQEQLALAADVDRSYISEIELAKNSASIDILEQIALALDVAPKELFNERG